MTFARLAWAAGMLAAGLAGVATAAVKPAPTRAAPQPYAPPQAVGEEESSCLDVAVESGPPGQIHLRNTCAVRINFALCLRRSDQSKGALSKGSLSPADVYSTLTPPSAPGRTFTHRANFCSGLLCQVVEPDC